MTALAVVNPIPQFYELDGDPLDGGHLWFGPAGLNPLTAQVQVYWDQAMTIPAAQPIRTIDGYPSRTGSPALVYVDGNYSLLVQDRRNKLILYIPNSAETSNYSTVLGMFNQFTSDLAATAGAGQGDALVGVKKTGGNPTTQHVVNEGRTVDPYVDYGADRTGSVNSSLAFEAALASSAKATLFLSAGTYRLSPELYLGIYKRIVGVSRDLVTLQFDIDSANGAAILLDQFCDIENVTIENIGTNKTTSIGICSYTPTNENGWANGLLSRNRIKGFGFGVGSSQVNNPAVQQLTRSQTFNTKIVENIFDDCLIPIQLGLGANATKIDDNWFIGTRGNYNIYISESYEPIIGSGNAFQGCLMQDVYLSSCFQPVVQGYYEPAMGIFADSCPGLHVYDCILNGQTLSAVNNNAFVRTTDASNASGYNYPLPIRSRVENITLDGSGVGKFCVNNDANCETITDNCVGRQGNWTINGARSYPAYFEGPWTSPPSLVGSTVAGSITYGANNSGWYQQRGKKVTAYFRLNWSATPTPPTGNLQIGNLPLFVSTLTNGGNLYSPPVLIGQWGPVTLSANYVHLSGNAVAGTQRIDLVQSASNGSTALALPGTAITTFGTIIGQVEYETP